MSSALPAHLVSTADDGQRLDRYLKNMFPQVPFIAIQKLLRTGQVRLNGSRCKGAERLNAGDSLRLPPSLLQQPQKAQTTSQAYQPTKADFAMLQQAIVYEDNHLIIINKPAGLASQAGTGITRSLDRLLVAAYPPSKPPRLVHRLDRDTTGIIIAAKNRTTAAALAQQFQQKSNQKTYLALVTGALPQHVQVAGQGGLITKPIKKVGPHAVIAPDGDSAETSWTLLASFPHADASAPPLHLIQASPHTGRMNQIRVHMASIGLPLVGDSKYGTPQSKQATRALHPTGAPPLYLHASKITFYHPSQQHLVTFTAPIPSHFEAYFTQNGPVSEPFLA